MMNFIKRILNKIKKEKKFYVCFNSNLKEDIDLRYLTDKEFKKVSEIWPPETICRFMNSLDGYPEVWNEGGKQYIMIRYI